MRVCLGRRGTSPLEPMAKADVKVRAGAGACACVFTRAGRVAGSHVPLPSCPVIHVKSRHLLFDPTVLIKLKGGEARPQLGLSSFLYHPPPFFFKNKAFVLNAITPNCASGRTGSAWGQVT